MHAKVKGAKCNTVLFKTEGIYIYMYKYTALVVLCLCGAHSACGCTPNLTCTLSNAGEVRGATGAVL